MENVIGNSQPNRLDSIINILLKPCEKTAGKRLPRSPEKLNVSPGMIRQRI